MQRSYYDGWRTIINWSQDPGTPAVMAFTTIDATGQYTSMAIGTDNFPVISYWDNTHFSLRVAHCNNAECSGTTDLTTVDATGFTGMYPSITIGTDHFPVISYYDAANGDLRVAHCDNAACTTSTKTTVDATGNTGWYTSVAIGTDNFPVISYYDGSNGDLRVAHCDNAACTTSTKTTVDATGNTGDHPSIAIGTDGFPVISYKDQTNSDLRVAHCINVTCSGATNLTTVDATGTTGLDGSITIGSDHFPVISYMNNTNGDLRVAHCDNTACTSSTNAAVDTTGVTGQYTSVALGADHLPVISYHDATNSRLRVVHCINVTCTP
ncbi:unannotated protein [freshwater metagenome]|uniref:Unannotated protein n=1 Tax=freshwater metagenome TaxID=449393 RepID=A0A6J7EBS8_9ZZZZ